MSQTKRTLHESEIIDILTSIQIYYDIPKEFLPQHHRLRETVEVNVKKRKRKERVFLQNLRRTGTHGQQIQMIFN